MRLLFHQSHGQFIQILGSRQIATTPEVTGEVTGEVGTKSRPESQPESLGKRVLQMLTANLLSKADISLALGQKEVSGQLNKVIRELLSARKIEHTIPDKPNSRLQKYRMTEKGKRFLKENK
jgi:hypothetical protein